MPARTTFLWATGWIFAGVWACSGAETLTVPLCCAEGMLKPELAPVSGIAATLTRIPPEQGGPAVRIAFSKQGTERRFLGLDIRPGTGLAAFKALSMSACVSVPEALSVRPAFIAYESSGGVWFRAGGVVSSGASRRERRLSLASPREAAFSDDDSGALEWAVVNRVWIGFLVDGAGEGTLELAKLTLTSEPYVPTEAVSLFVPEPRRWGMGADPAVTKSLERIDVGDDACLRIRFAFPGGRHMYVVPAQSVEEMEYSAYKGVRLTYKATVPKGIEGLLVSLYESGGQFIASPPPPATGEWVTVDLPFGAFKLGSWSKDNNGKLDADLIRKVSIGAHGIARGKGGEGEITIKAIEVVPPDA